MGIFGEFVTSQWADRVVGPYSKTSISLYLRRGGRLCPPAECTGFTMIFGEFATFRRADVGIGPYNHTRKCVRIRRKFPKKFTAFRRAEQSPALYQVLGKFVLPLKF